MSSLEQSDAFNRGHKQGFHAGYDAAMRDVWWILNKAQDSVKNIDYCKIEEKYHSIFRGLDDPTALEFLQEVMV